VLEQGWDHGYDVTWLWPTWCARQHARLGLEASVSCRLSCLLQSVSDTWLQVEVASSDMHLMACRHCLQQQTSVWCTCTGTSCVLTCLTCPTMHSGACTVIAAIPSLSVASSCLAAVTCPAWTTGCRKTPHMQACVWRLGGCGVAGHCHANKHSAVACQRSSCKRSYHVSADTTD
jgi:hypothetical protein